VARGIFGNPRASYKYVGYGLILEKMRGLSAKCGEMSFSRNYFVEEKPMDQVHGSVDHLWLGPPWTVCGRAARACQSLASSHSGSQGRQQRGEGRGDGVGEPVKGLSRGRAVARWPDEGERVAVVGALMRGSLELRERRRRE
jgi:hypothetical protein